MFRLVHKQLGSCRLKLYFFLCETRTVTCFFFLCFSVFFFFWKILLAIKLKLKIKIKKNIILTDFYWFNVYIAAVGWSCWSCNLYNNIEKTAARGDQAISNFLLTFKKVYQLLCNFYIRQSKEYCTPEH